MSTKATIAHDEHFHLYAECFENENVWIELDHPGLEASLSIQEGRTVLRVAVPVRTWRAMIAGWNDDSWSSDTERDGTKVEFSLDAFEEMLERMGVAKAANEAP